MSELSLILNRRREVEQDVARHREALAAGEKELAELEMAARVVARLSGAAWPPAGEENAERQEEAPGGKPEGTPSVPEMIRTVLSESVLDEMEPKEIAKLIASRWWPDVEGNRISSIAWRMWKRGELKKDEGSSAYRLPRKSEAPDADPGKETSEASDHHTDTEAKRLESQPREVGHDNMT